MDSALSIYMSRQLYLYISVNTKFVFEVRHCRKDLADRKYFISFVFWKLEQQLALLIVLSFGVVYWKLARYVNLVVYRMKGEKRKLLRYSFQ